MPATVSCGGPSPEGATLLLADVKASASSASTPISPPLALSSFGGDVGDGSSTTSVPADSALDGADAEKTDKDSTKRGVKRKRQGAPNERKKPQLDPADFKLTPWADDLGMTEYDSKEQRRVMLGGMRKHV